MRIIICHAHEKKKKKQIYESNETLVVLNLQTNY